MFKYTYNHTLGEIKKPQTNSACETRDVTSMCEMVILVNRNQEENINFARTDGLSLEIALFYLAALRRNISYHMLARRGAVFSASDSYRCMPVRCEC